MKIDKTKQELIRPANKSTKELEKPEHLFAA